MSVLPWIIAGLVWPLFLTGPPWPGTWRVLAALTPFLAGLAWLSAQPPGASRPVFIRMAVVCAAACWSAWHVERGLAGRWVEPPLERTVTGQVVSLPERRGERLSFRFQAEASSALGRPLRLEVRWFRAPATHAPAPGERWRLRLRVAPPRDRLNFGTGDTERFWFAERVQALGTVIADDAEWLGPARGTPVERGRAVIRARLARELEGLPGHGLVRALSLGDRSGLSEGLNAAMRATGTGHLLAISGLHVGLVALFGARLGWGLLTLLGWRSHAWPVRRLAPPLGLMLATAYALLAGFGTSPRRALVMVAVVVLALVLRRRVSPWRSWLLALTAVLLIDPLAYLQAGFWLSFGAVGVLLWLFLGRINRSRALPSLLRAQAGLMLAMLPMTLAWFRFSSFSALLVNLLAIPWVSVVTLPLILLSLPLLAGNGGLEGLPLHVAERSAALLERGLVGFHDHFGNLGWHAPAPGSLQLGLFTGGALLCLLPGGLRVRAFGGLLMLPLLLTPVLPERGSVRGAVQLDVLDVGQGQAVLVRTGRRLLLVDTGPGVSGRWSRADQVIRPAVIEHGTAVPTLVLVSHGDSDHAGGLADLRDAWPGVPVTASLGRTSPGIGSCDDRRRWRWDKVTFRVLHPTRWLPYRGNDSSCVLEIEAPGGAVLLPGDIGRQVERRLAASAAPRRVLMPGRQRAVDGAHRGDDPRQAQGYRLVLAPHHGSRTSSSETFLDWARPGLTVFSNAYGNRFGFPAQAVLERYADRRHAVTGTAACGALRFVLHPDGRLESRSARRSRAGFWRFPAAPHCPGSAGGGALTSPNAFRYHAGHSEKNLASKE